MDHKDRLNEQLVCIDSLHRLIETFVDKQIFTPAEIRSLLLSPPRQVPKLGFHTGSGYAGGSGQLLTDGDTFF